jgi:hypothetical protein
VYPSVLRFHGPSVSLVFLISDRLVKADLAAHGFQHQFSSRAQADVFHPCEFQHDRCWTGARMQDEVVFQLSVSAVINQIDSRIDILVLHLAKIGYVRAPPLGIASQEIAALAWEFVAPSNLRSRGRSHDTHGQDTGVGGDKIIAGTNLP